MTSSNFKPNQLYKDGLQRADFLPFINHITDNYDVIGVDSDTDHRRLMLNQSKTYFTPINKDTEEEFNLLFQRLVDINNLTNKIVRSKSREIEFTKCSANVAYCTFDFICNAKLAHEDYRNIAKEINSWKNVDVLYFADSFGNMLPEDVYKVTKIFKKNFKKEVGVHLHNNKGFGLINAVYAAKAGIDWIDSTILGMGRGSGNVSTESIILEMNSMGMHDGDIYKIENIEQKKPDLNDNQIKKEVMELISQKNKFDYNRGLLEKIQNKEFTEDDFLNLGKNKIKSIKLNSIKDNNTFEINSVQMLYSLPTNSFTLINDENDNIYLAKIKDYDDMTKQMEQKDFEKFLSKENTKIRNDILKSYDLFLNKKYDVDINQTAINNVKNLFQ